MERDNKLGYKRNNIMYSYLLDRRIYTPKERKEKYPTRIKACQSCGKAWESWFTGSQKGLEIYDNFPTYGLERSRCLYCKKDMKSKFYFKLNRSTKIRYYNSIIDKYKLSKVTKFKEDRGSEPVSPYVYHVR